MERTCRWGYWMLLCRAWQSEDCTVSADPLDLAQDSDLGDDLWAQYGPRILRKFEVLENGRLRNAVLFDEWKTAKSKFEKAYCSEDELRRVRSEAGKKGAKAKWEMANQKHLPSGEGQKMANSTEQDSTEQTIQKPSRAKAARATKTAIADERHTDFKEAIRAYWNSKNAGIDMPWGPMEGKQLGMWLREAPNVTLEQFKGMLRGRFKSDVNHGERPAQWIRWITSYLAPVDRFAKPFRAEAPAVPLVPGAQNQTPKSDAEALAMWESMSAEFKAANPWMVGSDEQGGTSETKASPSELRINESSRDDALPEGLTIEAYGDLFFKRTGASDGPNVRAPLYGAISELAKSSTTAGATRLIISRALSNGVHKIGLHEWLSHGKWVNPAPREDRGGMSA